MRDLREKAEATGRWRVWVGYTDRGERLFRNNWPGDPLPEPGADHGISAPENVDEGLPGLARLA